MPELGKNSLSKLAKDMEKKIKAQTPDSLRQSVKARPYKKGDATGIAIDYDDRALGFLLSPPASLAARRFTRCGLRRA